MFVAAHPTKGRSDSEKAEMAGKYKPGDQVLPKIVTRERTEEERRADEEEQRLVEEVRQISLQEAGGTPAPSSRTRRRRESRSRSTGEVVSERPRRRTRDDGSRRPRTDHAARSSSEHLEPEGDRRRGRRSHSGQRQVEHQSSLRSLISSAGMSEREIEREIEAFARQIQEEGLLEGLDLDNIDLTRDDELSRRITDAYRRRQRGRSRQERSARSNAGGQSSANRPSDSTQTESRPAVAVAGNRSRSRQQTHSRSASATSHAEDRSRPPPSMSANLDVRDAASRTRRRAASSGRSTTVPAPSPLSPPDSRPATRSQVDLPLRSQTSDSEDVRRPTPPDARSSSTPNVSSSSRPSIELPAGNSDNLQSFASRMPAEASSVLRDASPSQRSSTPPEHMSDSSSRSYRPADLSIVHSTITNPGSKSPTGHGHQRTRSQLFPEPSISCSRCHRTHIEYEIHYNCQTCGDGQWNICLDCYRAGKGCLYWFGFGYGAWNKWEKARRQSSTPPPMPHMLTASRYTPPPSTPGGADGRKTLTTDDPRNRLESGTFCARCFVWTNQCFWRCDVCNEGDWGFCNNCVNQGKCCSHMLLPLAHEATRPDQGLPPSPRSPGIPPAASILTGPTASNIGPFRPLTFNTRCDVCQAAIPPADPRYHCFSCTSGLVADATMGDYDICFPCYNNLVTHGEISDENGHSGWRRCLNGHRMTVVSFAEGKVGQWRYIDRDLVGGRALRSEPFETHGKNFHKWSWVQGEQRWERLATVDVRDTAPASDGSVTFSQSFPPDGGIGSRGMARWAWYPKAGVDDELLFPRGAEISEIEDINGEWCHGTYMGTKGLFPAQYVRLEQAP